MPREQKDLNIRIGKRLQEVRENNGYTQERFAEILDVGVEHYRKLESGRHGLHPKKMLILYQEFKIDPTYLITGERNLQFNVEVFLSNCDRDQRDKFIERILEYMKNLMINSK